MTTSTIQQTLTNNTTDNIFIGETITTPKPSNTTRLYYTNINGISSSNRYERFHHVLDSMTNLQVDMISLAEHNLAVDQSQTQYNFLHYDSFTNCNAICTTL